MRKLELNKVYKHFKGDLYIVLDVAINSETDKKMLCIERYMMIANYMLGIMICF